jgi:hypothetical protein
MYIKAKSYMKMVLKNTGVSTEKDIAIGMEES